MQGGRFSARPAGVPASAAVVRQGRQGRPGGARAVLGVPGVGRLDCRGPQTPSHSGMWPRASVAQPPGAGGRVAPAVAAAAHHHLAAQACRASPRRCNFRSSGWNRHLGSNSPSPGKHTHIWFGAAKERGKLVPTWSRRCLGWLELGRSRQTGPPPSDLIHRPVPTQAPGDFLQALAAQPGGEHRPPSSRCPKERERGCLGESSWGGQQGGLTMSQTHLFSG